MKGQVPQGFDSVRVPTSEWRLTPSLYVPVMGLSPSTSTYNLQARTAEPGGTNFRQQVQTRVPTGWATNSYSSPIAQPYGGAFGGGQSV